MLINDKFLFLFLLIQVKDGFLIIYLLVLIISLINVKQVYTIISI